MRELICLLFVGAVLATCSQREPVVTRISCNATQEYAKTVNEAAQRLVGSWKLVRVSVGFQQPPPAPNQVVDFDDKGMCVVTRDGQRSGPFLYSLSLAPLTGSSTTLLPQLMVNDNTQPAIDFLRLGTAHLFVCEEELVLDYGSAIDGPSYTYRRQTQ